MIEIETVAVRCKCSPLEVGGCIHRLSRKLNVERDETRHWVRYPPKTGLAVDLLSVGQMTQRCPKHGTPLHENGSDQRLYHEQHRYPHPVCFRCLEDEPDSELHELTLQLMGRGAGRPPKATTDRSLNSSEWKHLLEEYLQKHPTDDPALAYKAYIDVCRRAKRPREPERWLRHALAREVRSRSVAAKEKEVERLDMTLSQLGPTARSVHESFDEVMIPVHRENLSDLFYSSSGSAASERADHDEDPRTLGAE